MFSCCFPGVVFYETSDKQGTRDRYCASQEPNIGTTGNSERAEKEEKKTQKGFQTLRVQTPP